MLRLNDHTIDENKLPEAPVVLDVGSRNFGFSNAVLQLRPKARVFAMEPDPIIKNPNLPGITFISEALVADNRLTSKYESYSTGEGNFLTDLPIRGHIPHVHDAAILTVNCTNISCLMQKTGINYWDLVKLDCEGAEFDILENWPGPIAAQISVEFHDWDRLSYYPDSYYADLWNKLPWYDVTLFKLTPIGPGASMGHWDSLLTLKR